MSKRDWTSMHDFEDIKLENCIYQKDVIDALFRQVNDQEIKPFKQNSLPGKIFCADFDMGRNGFAYSDKDLANYAVSSGDYSAWNKGWAYRNDGVDIERCDDTAISNGFNVGWTEDGEWLNYTVHVEKADSFLVNLRAASDNNTGKFRIDLDGNTGLTFSVGNTGGWQKWETFSAEKVHLSTGTHVLKLEIIKGNFNINFIEFIGLNIDGSNNGEKTSNFHLYQNYPNPFNPGTSIEYTLKKSGRTKLNIYNSLGKLVLNLLNKIQPEGTYTEYFSGAGLASGIYYYQLQYEGNSKQRMMILLR